MTTRSGCLLVWSGSSQAAPTPPKLINPKQLETMFDGESSINRYLQQERSPQRLLNASLYYFYSLVGLFDKMSAEKGPQKHILDQTIEMLEEASRAEPQNPLYAAVLGNTYGIKITFSGFPALLNWSKKCQTQLNRAVRISNDDPEIRLLRLRSMGHFPYQYYKQLRDQNVEDANAVLQWVADVEAAGNTDAAMKSLYDSYLINVKNEVYLTLGRYFAEQVKDRAVAISYLSKADRSCWKYCSKAQQMLADLR